MCVDRTHFDFEQFSDRSLRELAFVTEYERASTPLGKRGDDELDRCEQLRLAFRASRYRIRLDLWAGRGSSSLLGRRVRPSSRLPLPKTIVRPVTDRGVEIDRAGRRDLERLAMTPQRGEDTLDYVLRISARVDDNRGVVNETRVERLEDSLEPSVIAAPEHSGEVFNIRRWRRRTTRTTRE